MFKLKRNILGQKGIFCSALFVFEAKCRRCTTNCILVQMSLFGLYLVSHLRKACTITCNFFILADDFMKSRVMYYSKLTY